MFSTIHNSPTVLEHLPTAGFPAFMAAFAIAMVAGSASAYANCERHVYNNSGYVWRMTIENQPSNNLVDYTLQPGESKSYWLVTNSVSKNVWLRQVEGQIGIRKGDEVTYLGNQYNDCHIKHNMKEKRRSEFTNGFIRNTNYLSWNEPAGGDVTIYAGVCGR